MSTKPYVSAISAPDESTIRIVPGVPAGARVRPPTVIAVLRCVRIVCPALELFDEMGSSITKSSVESNGRIPLDGTGDGLADETGMGVGGVG
jgi:hypothetical protein